MNKNRVFNVVVGCAAAGGLACGSSASAQTIAYDNMGPGNAFEAGTGMLVRGEVASTSPWAAFFNITPQASGGITEISYALAQGNGNNLYWFQVYADDFGQIGTLLGEWIAPSDVNANLPVTATFDGTFQLEAGVTYWMGFMPAPDSNGTWRRNSFGETKDRWAWRGPGVWTLFANSNMSALRVMVSEGPTCPPDINGDGVVDADDFFEFLSLFAAGDMRADFNNDGVIDADDFFMFLNLFAAGC